MDDGLLAGWRARAARAAEHLHWASHCVARSHVRGTTLALVAPVDQLFVATEVNEWALCAALVERQPDRRSTLEAALGAAAETGGGAAGDAASAPPPVIDEAAAMARFERLAGAEAKPPLRALLDEAAVRGLPHALDELELTLGSGTGGQSWSLAALPAAAEVAWRALHGIPTALVTGSNGKTTTVRLLAACARAHGWQAGYNCTDGVFIDDDTLAAGDYSGPAGARLVMRERRTEAAILETARGGILRRGIAASHADTAVVTNVSADHFGEYGIDDLAALADVKLSVAAVVGSHGLLVLNADDAVLRTRAAELGRRYGRCPPLGWFARDWDAGLGEYRGRGDSACGVCRGRLLLSHRGMVHDLGPVDAMPLSVGGLAAYNVANLAGAALAAVALGIPAAIIAAVFATFGARLTDNPGRMMRFDLGARVVVDYAHNPDGLRGLLNVAQHWRGTGRLGLLLGHAGNRQNADIEALARVAVEFRPDLVVVKENETQLRGRAPGDIPRIIGAELRRLGMPESALQFRASELEAARTALDWARPGDVLAMPVHSQTARTAVVALLDGWRPTPWPPQDRGGGGAP